MNEYCQICKRVLTNDEKALTRKMINRGTDKYFCITCLSLKFCVTEETLLQKIEDFKEMGCTLFQQ